MASNLLEGPIPLDIESLNALQYLDLSDNKLRVKPSQFESLTQLNILNLSRNNLTGMIPEFLVYGPNPDGLLHFAPEEFKGNKDLCGSIQGFLPCPSSPSVNQERNSKVKHNLLVFILVPTLLFFVTTFALIAFEDIIKATEDFDIKYCIGTDTSFRNEIKFLTEIRHKNIVKLHGFCLHNRCMLVYEYMEKGNFIDDEVVEMDWIKRVNIVKGVAHALSYMHHDYNPPIVHRDISSNNILLNSELEAFIVDFGTARFLNPDSSNQTVIVGTYGYIAPGDIIFFAVIAFACLQARPKARPTIKLVSQEFLHVKYPIAMPLHKISLIKLKDHEIFMRDESHNK
uniref:non-specific serine/threonine protein kinase n=1 Tax=Gossypium raimondii TaxID=29730 RepID=A0A0D2RP66_GOSRA|nr:hypothetical protein B456_006G022600 [Gossypium raimondii]